MRTGNMVAALATVVLGLFMAIEAGNMNIGFTGGLHAGIFPRLLGFGLGLLGVIQLLQELRLASAGGGGIAWPQGRYRRQLLAVSAAVIGYLLAITWLGFAVTTWVFSLAVIRVLGDYRWPMVGFAALVTAGLSTLVFQVLLDLKLPGGWLGY